MGEQLRFQENEKSERRKYARIATNLYITYSISGKEFSEAGIFISKNVSGGGILFESFRQIPVGTVFDLAIHLPTFPFPLSAKGKVVRLKKTRHYGRYDVGMSLIEISEKERRELIKYLISTFLTQRDCESLFGTEEEEGNSVFEEEILKRPRVKP